jgi:hypothetical protein
MIKEEFDFIEDCIIDKSSNGDISVEITENALDSTEYQSKFEALNAVESWANTHKSTKGVPCTHDVYDDSIDSATWEEVSGFEVSIFGIGAGATLNDNDQVYVCRDCEVVIKRISG